jgi:N6-adenosine-specific RNA methylase IME4
VKLAEKIDKLPDTKFGVILADPGWKYSSWSEEGKNRSPENHYSCEALEEIMKLPVQSIAADDAVLFLWTTVAFAGDSHEILKAWGFEYVTQLVWVKNKTSLGFWFRNKHEILLVARRAWVDLDGRKKNGKPVCPAPGTQWTSVLEAPAREHSRKPDKVYELIEEFFPNLPKIELNCRGKPRPGWSAWGNEAEPEAETATPAAKPKRSHKKKSVPEHAAADAPETAEAIEELQAAE